MSGQSLDKERHLRYWKRCFRTYLPSQYTSHDSTRMAIAFFIVAAFDLLSPPSASEAPQQLTADDRAKIRSWVLGLQHPAGGFSGSPTHALPAHLCIRHDAAAGASPQGVNSGEANIAATYFALLLLAIAGDGAKDGGSDAFAGVDREATLRWLRRLQRPDGSFGELVLDDGTIEGGRDMRLCYLASMIRWSLRGDVKEDDPGWVEDIDTEGLVEYIRRGQVYDGGMAEWSEHESHAGYAYCAVGALYLLDRPLDSVGAHDSQTLQRGIPDREGLISFLAHRQFAYLQGSEDGDDDDEDEGGPARTLPQKLKDLSLDDASCVGFNGRCNKVADTCYCWWVGGTFAMLAESPAEILCTEASRNFLFTKTQHLIGGFSKHPGGPPDVHHGYLGIAALATMGDSSLKPFDPSLCVSTETTAKIIAARTALLNERKASEAWGAKFQATTDFWSGKEAVWPKTTLDDAAQQKLAKALEMLA